jgi:N6-L-threonylcarbamoyladenine synthase
MNILAIETSCDETAIALVEFHRKKQKGSLEIKILADEIASQIKIHAPYGGVVPGLAAREHIKNLSQIFQKILKNNESDKEKISNFMKRTDLIAVTSGPGLMPCLLTGTSFAKALAYKYKKPIIGTNHLEGHLFSGLIKLRFTDYDLSSLFPALGLIVSGGHTELILVKAIGEYKLIGETLDDAAGEAFDKVARLLGLGYPGGPAIEKVAKNGDKDRFKLPRPMIGSPNYNFSFSGLKTAVLYKIKNYQGKSKTIKENQKLSRKTKTDMAASFQKAVIETLIKKTENAIKELHIRTLLVGGGVLTNDQFREELKMLSKRNDVNLILPKKIYCGDNAVMIALAAYLNYCRNKNYSWQGLRVNSNLGF